MGVNSTSPSVAASAVLVNRLTDAASSLYAVMVPDAGSSGRADDPLTRDIIAAGPVRAGAFAPHTSMAAQSVIAYLRNFA